MIQTLKRHMDVVMAVGFLTVSILDLYTNSHNLDPGPLDVLIPAVICLPLAARRRAPLIVACIIGAGITIYTFRGMEPATGGEFWAYVVAAYTLGAHATTMQMRIGVAVLIATALSNLTVVVASAADLPLGAGMVIGPAIVGRIVRDRRDKVAELERLNVELAESRAAQARLAAESERTRIAREMHDVLSHGVSLMTLQAGAGERTASGRDAAAFATIREAGASTMTELRRLLGLLRESPGEQPGLADLTELADRTRESGLDVRVHGRAPTLPPALDLTALRIVQEALTNVVRHADAQTVDVRLAQEAGALRLLVEDDGRGPNGHHGSGHGLLGMRERVALYGGELVVGRSPSGGFSVCATLPLGEPA